ncbi:hypothetical protein BDB00DRAFT_801152 [Zychaea mexicana]|uniref:uncharacterized protein n=1 Tax=Zychaea mexicana TaxID=64656 RepID=UPI0022FE592B|nr:uncharacterized protein BDB00DRAFT_801152 [Zychaea mexicana]KAI9498105.1 hypothetical protein BDB00DRAFT_801152 [Zychaea mexicana]
MTTRRSLARRSKLSLYQVCLQLYGRTYLRTFHSDKDAWKFKKISQVWCLHHMYDENVVSFFFVVATHSKRGRMYSTLA